MFFERHMDISPQIVEFVATHKFFMDSSSTTFCLLNVN